MELGKKQLTTVFTVCAGLGFGAVLGVANLMQNEEVDAEKTSVSQASSPKNSDTARRESPVPAQPSAPSAVETVTATVTSTQGDSVFHARVHTWVAQFAMVSVCVKGQVPSPKACQYEAAVEGDIRKGADVRLTGMDHAQGSVAPHTIAADIPNMRPRQDVLPGPVRARVLKLVDGDTVQIVAESFRGHHVLTDIRIGDIDTPEKKGRAKCAEEAALAEKASAETRRLVEGETVYLYNVQFEKYGGRVLGDMRTADGKSVAQNLIDKGLARAYDGGKKSSWCGIN